MNDDTPTTEERERADREVFECYERENESGLTLHDIRVSDRIHRNRLAARCASAEAEVERLRGELQETSAANSRMHESWLADVRVRNVRIEQMEADNGKLREQLAALRAPAAPLTVPDVRAPASDEQDEGDGVFIVDPIEGLLQCAARRWPMLNVRVQFTDDDMPEGATGCTSIPPEGEEGPTIITLRPGLPGVTAILGVLAHELAHAATGTTHDCDEGHGEAWKAAHHDLHEDFLALDGYMPLRCVGPLTGAAPQTEGDGT